MAKVGKKFCSVCDIVPDMDGIWINVRVLRLWKVPSFLNPSETSSIEMVLLDDKGGKIHASVRKQLVYLFESKLVEGELYEMSMFSVSPQTGFYRTSLHPYKLNFQIKTKLQASIGVDINGSGLSFTNLAEVCAHDHDYEFLVDVIGVMTGISAEREYVRDCKITKMVVIELTDASGKCECALFGEYADELSKKMGKMNLGLPIVIVQFAKVKIFRDKASIQNVMNTTRIFVNPDLPEVEEFKNGIALHGIDLDMNVPLIGGSAKPAPEEEFLKMYPKKKVGMLSDMEEDGVFAVYGVVAGFVGGEEWWYLACKCHRAVVADSGAYYCNGCVKHIFQVVPRFKVKVEVSDGESTSVFVLFDVDMSCLMEKSCAYFVAQAKSPSDNGYPTEFDSLIGKKLLFTIEKSSKQSVKPDGSYRVKRVCSDAKIIESFIAQGPYVTPTKAINPPIDVESDDGLDDLEVVADSQPISFLKNLIVTPPGDGNNIGKKDTMLAGMKRSLGESFNAADQVPGKKRLRKVKIEKE